MGLRLLLLYFRALLTKDNQFGLQRLEVDDVKGTKKHSQGNQQHRRADAVESNNHITNYGQNTPSLTSLTALHAVQDEPQEDEGVVAVVNFHIFYNPLAHLSEVARFGKLALVHKAGPRSNGHTASVEPLFGYTG